MCHMVAVVRHFLLPVGLLLGCSCALYHAFADRFQAGRVDLSTLRGGACWELAVVDCDAEPGNRCNETGCSWSLFSGWSCPSGSRETSQDSDGRYVCEEVLSGREICTWNGNDPNWPVTVCWSYQYCTSACILDTGGNRWCAGPTGPSYIGQAYYVPVLSGANCTVT
jgi:hypothetical protein